MIRLKHFKKGIAGRKGILSKKVYKRRSAQGNTSKGSGKIWYEVKCSIHGILRTDGSKGKHKQGCSKCGKSRYEKEN